MDPLTSAVIAYIMGVITGIGIGVIDCVYRITKYKFEAIETEDTGD